MVAVGPDTGGVEPINASVDVVCLLARLVVFMIAVIAETTVMTLIMISGIRGTAPADQ